MQGLFKDLTEQVLGYFTVLEYVGKNKWGHAMWKCRCVCGEIRTLSTSNLHSINPSCGCKKLERAFAGVRLTHGCAYEGKHTVEYTAWVNMKARSINHNRQDWKNYGGRGILICTRWLRSFEAFLADLGPRPLCKTLDRINNNGHYIPSNVRWATKKQQTNNRRQQGSMEPVITFVDVL